MIRAYVRKFEQNCIVLQHFFVWYDYGFSFRKVEKILKKILTEVEEFEQN